MSKFKYLIFPEHVYTFEINGKTFDMLGSDILDAVWVRLDDGK